MARLYPCLKGKLGTTEYFVTVMKAGDVIRDISSADELKEWKDFTIEERLQREINWDRIKSEIAPYFIEDKDRFFGSLIVDIYNDDGVEFEPISSAFKSTNKFYESAGQAFGFLVLGGGERLFALDGQHRLKSMQVAITGKGKDGELIEELEFDPDLALEDVTVIMVRHGESSSKVRKIFNKINKYAKPTSKGDNIITAEDDPFAIIARKLIGPDSVFKEDHVNWRSNTLTKTAKQFTTIGTLYECATILLRQKGLSKDALPTDLNKYYTINRDVWTELLHEFEPFCDLINSIEINVLREKLLVGKPVGQMALLEAIQICIEHGVSVDKLTALVHNLNQIDWSSSSKLWEDVMYEPSGRIKANSSSRRLAARIIAYLVGCELTDDEKSTLLTDYRHAKGDVGALLPNPVTPLTHA